MIGSDTSKHRRGRAERGYLPLNFNNPARPRSTRDAGDEGDLPAYRAGDCETCGQWDSELQEGMCQWCRQQHGLAEGV